MVPSRGTNTGPSCGPNTWSAGGPKVPSRGTNTGPLRVNTRSNSTQQGNQHWPLLWAQHLVGRKSNGTQQGNQHWTHQGPNTGLKGGQTVPNRGTNTGPSCGPTTNGQQEVQW
jgi:hypothetical protein